MRVEQLYPFPSKTTFELLAKTPNAEVIWCQEEPKNMGGWTFVRDFIEDAMQAASMRQSRLKYAGRHAAASPATGSFARHVKEQKQLVAEALGPMAAGSKKAASAKK